MDKDIIVKDIADKIKHMVINEQDVFKIKDDKFIYVETWCTLDWNRCVDEMYINCSLNSGSESEEEYVFDKKLEKGIVEYGDEEAVNDLVKYLVDCCE
jgi:hypothetical protein